MEAFGVFVGDGVDEFFYVRAEDLGVGVLYFLFFKFTLRSELLIHFPYIILKALVMIKMDLELIKIVG